MTFRQFAFRNVSRNRRTYAAFFLSSAFSVMIFFIYAAFIFHPEIQNAAFNWSAVTAITVAEYMIYLFSVFFVFYSVSAFLKSRKREFGVLIMHGMTYSQLRRMVFIENMVIGVASIVAGLAAGMLASRLFMLIGADVMQRSPLAYYTPIKAILLTLAAFVLLFLVISTFTAVFVRASTPIDLLKGSAKPKSEPASSWLLSLAAVLLLGSGYAISFVVESYEVALALIPVVVMVVIGTYFLYAQLSVFVIRALRRNRSLFMRKTNMLVFSDMAYRMKDNARMLFLVTIISTVSICAMGSLMGYQQTIHKQISDAYPFAYNYIQNDGDAEQAANQAQIIAGVLEERGIRYDKLSARLVEFDSIDGQSLNLIRMTEYNEFAQALNQPVLSMYGNEAAAIWTIQRPLPEREWSVKGRSGEFIPLGIHQIVDKTLTPPVVDKPLLVVADELFDALGVPKEQRLFTAYHTDGADSTVGTGQVIAQRLGKTGDSGYWFSSPAVLEAQMKRENSLLLFVGLFVSSVFFVASGSFLYFRLYTDLNDERQKYHAMAKIGLTDKELGKVATLHMGLLFLAPLAIALVHSSVALYALHNMVYSTVTHSAIIVFSVFITAQILYFLAIRSRYMKRLKQAAGSLHRE